MSQAELSAVTSISSNKVDRQNPQIWQEPLRSPEMQAEVERIGTIEPYVGLIRDRDLFVCLNSWRDRRTCGRIMTVDRLGVFKTLNYYTTQQTKRRGDLIRIPAPVAYIEVEATGNARNLFLSILDFLANSVNCGSLRDLRARTWATIRKCGVKILIVNYADLLVFSGLNELMRIAEKCKISVVLSGTSRLDEILDTKNRKKYLSIHNTFLNCHQFSLLSSQEISAVVNGWEQSLNWDRQMNLSTDTEIIKTLHEVSGGQIQPLYDRLKQIAVWQLDSPSKEINPQNISKLLINAQSPQTGVG